MSITCPVGRRVRSLAVVVLVVAAVAPVATEGVAGARPGTVAGRPAAPRGPEDIAGRIASLSALVSRRTTVVTSATARRDDLRVRLGVAQEQETAAMDRTTRLAEVEADAAVRYEKSRARVADLAAAAYRDGPSVAPITHLLSAKSAADYSYRHELVERVGALQRDMVRQAKHDRIAARRAADEARAERTRLHTLVDSLRRALPDREAALTAATASRDRAQFWLARWQAIAGGTATPIMGTSRLGPDELTEWFTATRHEANTTVPIAELADDYIGRARRSACGPTSHSRSRCSRPVASRSRRAGRSGAPTTTSRGWARATAATAACASPTPAPACGRSCSSCGSTPTRTSRTRCSTRPR
jgi:hypothetical protein